MFYSCFLFHFVTLLKVIEEKHSMCLVLMYFERVIVGFVSFISETSIWYVEVLFLLGLLISLGLFRKLHMLIHLLL